MLASLAQCVIQQLKLRLRTGNSLCYSMSSCQACASAKDCCLQGQNMIVGMGDTGLDVFHCHFSDSSYPASSFQASILRDSAGTYYYDNLSHRKVRYYRFFKDNRDANGHGTHCAGSAMGAPEFGGCRSHYPGLQRLSACPMTSLLACSPLELAHACGVQGNHHALSAQVS